MSAAPGLPGLPSDFQVDAPPLPRPTLFGQFWDCLAFIHWPVRRESVAHLYPPGTRPDVFGDGFTYVGLIPFAMRRAGLGSTRAVPYFGSFLETNIRLYSVDDAGRHGVLFRSLDASRFVLTPAARLAFGIDYTWSRMRLHDDRERGLIRYENRRRFPQRGLVSRLTLQVGEPVEPTPLEVFLTARWGAHSRAFGRTVWVPNEHDAWPLRAAQVLDLDDELLGASGVEAAGPPLRALWSPGVRTRFGRPSVVH